MKRIRFVRLVNWLCRVLLGRPGAPPSPMVMRGTPSFTITPELQRAAKKAGIDLR